MNSFEQLLTIFPNAVVSPVHGDYEWYDIAGTIFGLPADELSVRERQLLQIWAHPCAPPQIERGLWQTRLTDESFLMKQPFRLISLALTYKEREAFESFLDVLQGFFEDAEVIITSDFRIDILESALSDLQDIEEMLAAVANDLYIKMRVLYSQRPPGPLSPVFKLHERLLITQKPSTKAYPASQLFYQELLRSPATLTDKQHQTADVFARLDVTGIEIIEAFFKHTLNVSNTAKALYMHRNTLNYRLDRLFETTGYDVRNFYDASLLYLIITLHKND